MENSSINSHIDVLKKKNLQIRLSGHCIICLRKVSINRKGNCGTSEYVGGDGDGSSAPEIALKSVVTTPGFLTTFNQVWTVLRSKWKEKNSTKMDGNDGSSDQIGISLENIFQNGCGSTNVSFSRAPTICQLCCDKVQAVENLMKAVRQQVREISMLFQQVRGRQVGGLCDLEKSLRGKGLEESVVKATLQFVGILELEPISSQNNFKGDGGCAETNTKTGIVDDLECDEDNNLGSSQIYSDDSNEGQTGELGDKDDDGESDYFLEEELDEDDEDPDYIKSEPEEDDDNEDESEEEMEVDEEDKNDPDYEVETDPLAAIPPNKRKKDNPSFPANQQDNDHGSKFPCNCGKTFATFLKLRDHMRKSPKKHPEYKPFSYRESAEDTNKIHCSCGKMFGKMKTLREHMRKNKDIHPEYEPFKGTVLGNRQVCELCGQRVMHNEMLEHFKEAHLNGQAEWVIRCPNDKCPYMFVSSREFHLHLHRDNGKECKKIWKEKWGHVCETCGFKGTNLLKIRNHVKDKHENGKEEKKWTCPISGCGKRFCVKQSVHFHIHEHRNRRITQQNCDKCGEGVDIGGMERHLKDKHGIEEVIGCKQCPFKFSGREEMVEHLFEHRDVGFLCDICGDKLDKFAGRYSEFREHYFAVHKLCPKKFKCEEGDSCEMWFWRKETKESHVLRMHRESSFSIRYRKSLVGEKGKKEFECDVCNVKFVLEDTLISHKIKIHGADPFKCDICGETFHIKYSFNKHRKEHTGIVYQKEWNCEVEGCGKTFKDKKLWTRDKEVGHGGEKKHVCEECGKSYCDARGLRCHRNSVHLGLRPCVCDECGERFSSSTVLKRHKLIHTGERPFGCDICGQRFRHKEVLRRHKVGHEEKGAGFKPNGPMKQNRKRKAQ